MLRTENTKVVDRLKRRLRQTYIPVSNDGSCQRDTVVGREHVYGLLYSTVQIQHEASFPTAD